MSWLSEVGAGVAGALIVALVLSEGKGWAPRFTQRFLDKAISRLPAQYQDRLSEEWSAALYDLPTILSRLLFVVGLRWAAERIRWTAGMRPTWVRIGVAQSGGLILSTVGRVTSISIPSRLQGIGWFLSGVVVAPAAYMLSVEVAEKRAELAVAQNSIVTVQAEIRALQREQIRAAAAKPRVLSPHTP